MIPKKNYWKYRNRDKSRAFNIEGVSRKKRIIE